MAIGNFLLQKLFSGSRDQGPPPIPGAAPPELPMGGPMPMSYNAGAQDPDAQARAAGFRNREEMLLWAKQRYGKHENPAQGGGGMFGVLERAVKDPGAAFDQMMAIHPRNMFNNIRDAWRGAMERDQ